MRRGHFAILLGANRGWRKLRLTRLGLRLANGAAATWDWPRRAMLIGRRLKPALRKAERAFLPVGWLPLNLRLVAQTLLVAVFFHPLAAFVLGDFCFSSFFQRAHRGVSRCQFPIGQGPGLEMTPCDRTRSRAAKVKGLRQLATHFERRRKSRAPRRSWAASRAWSRKTRPAPALAAIGGCARLNSRGPAGNETGSFSNDVSIMKKIKAVCVLAVLALICGLAGCATQPTTTTTTTETTTSPMNRNDNNGLASFLH